MFSAIYVCGLTRIIYYKLYHTLTLRKNKINRELRRIINQSQHQLQNPNLKLLHYLLEFLPFVIAFTRAERDVTVQIHDLESAKDITRMPGKA